MLIHVMRMALLCAVICVPPIAAAKSSGEVPITVDEMFSLIERNNSDVKVARRAIEVSRQGEKVAESARLPQLDASLSLNFLGDATILDRDFSDATGAPMPHFGNTLKVTGYQPVYAGGAIKTGIELARTQTLISELGLENTRLATRMKAISCYLNIFKCRNLLKVYEENISLTEKLITEMRVKNSQGVVLKNDITRYELRLSTLNYDLTAIKSDLDVINHDLVSLLGLDPQSKIIPDSTILSATMPLENLSAWQQLALDNSLALRQVDAGKTLAVNNDKIVKSQRMPHVGITAGNIFDGPITVEVPPINKNLNYWWVGVNVSYNISSLFKTNKEVKKSELELLKIDDTREATVDAIDRNVKNAFSSYVKAHEQVGTQTKNVELAVENYRVVNHRFNNQLALLTDMLDASTSLLDAQVRLINAQINIQYYYYQLKFISGTL